MYILFRSTICDESLASFGGLHNPKEAFSLLTQLSRVRILALFKRFLNLAPRQLLVRYSGQSRSLASYNFFSNFLACGGNIQSESGVIDFPPGDISTYPHNLSCAYVVTTSQSKVLNLTFANTFHIEGTPGACRYDWLQVQRRTLSWRRNVQSMGMLSNGTALNFVLHPLNWSVRSIKIGKKALHSGESICIGGN